MQASNGKTIYAKFYQIAIGYGGVIINVIRGRDERYLATIVGGGCRGVLVMIG